MGDPSPPHAYLQQFARAYRFRLRYASLIASQSFEEPSRFTDLEDFHWAAFQNCWHVKDWLAKDPSVLPAVRRAAVKQAESLEALLIAADMANGTKHYWAHGDRAGAADGPMQFDRLPEGRHAVNHLVVLPDGRRLTALEALDNALQAWHDVLRQRALPDLARHRALSIAGCSRRSLLSLMARRFAPHHLVDVTPQLNLDH